MSGYPDVTSPIKEPVSIYPYRSWRRRRNDTLLGTEGRRRRHAAQDNRTGGRSAVERALSIIHAITQSTAGHGANRTTDHCSAQSVAAAAIVADHSASERAERPTGYCSLLRVGSDPDAPGKRGEHAKGRDQKEFLFHR